MTPHQATAGRKESEHREASQALRSRHKGAGNTPGEVVSDLIPRRDENGPAEAGVVLKTVAGSDSVRLNTVLLRAVLGCLPCPAAEAPEIREQRVGAALDAVKGFGPRDAVEGMLAAQAMAMHLAGMAALQRSQRPDLPVEIASKLRRDGAGLCRGVVEMAEAIGRRRDGGARQVVRVERVVVQEGGQAIVGAVAPPGGGTSATREGSDA